MIGSKNDVQRVQSAVSAIGFNLNITIIETALHASRFHHGLQPPSGCQFRLVHVEDSTDRTLLEREGRVHDTGIAVRAYLRTLGDDVQLAVFLVGGEFPQRAVLLSRLVGQRVVEVEVLVNEDGDGHFRLSVLRVGVENG